MRLRLVAALFGCVSLSASATVPSALPASSGGSSSSILNRRIDRQETLAHALYAAGLAEVQVEGIIGALQGVFDFRRSREGDQFRLVISDGELDFFDYRQGPLDEWQVRRDGEHYVGSKRELEVERKVALVDLTVESSLYEAAQAAGEDPSIAMSLADVFAWDIDFYQDVRKGDHARAVVEKFLSKGRLVRYGEVLAADYTGSSVGDKSVYRYQLPSGDWSYFQEDGRSARKTFLKSPLKYAHVTSGFGMRFHPVLQYQKQHQGVDYGAAVGTPVWAVADGTVVKATRDAVAGNHVCLRHMNGYETCYLHLSAFGAGIRAGARVAQKQVVGLSGATGRVTGPHLHFALKKNGVFVNPLAQKFPRAEPLPPKLLQDFIAKVAPFKSLLTATPVASASAPTAVSPAAAVAPTTAVTPAAVQ